ncbi:efflux transporter outer membrane subunit [Salinisphaera sp. T31B1]|uniref:efflux transporter outer membrane subunit n=1 Tax=Salinisphaera sp. T31B1 TaxID=727963 RepID=UPI003341B028
MCLLTAVVLASAGCATTPLPELAEPAFVMPQRFARSGEAPMDSRWWRNFDDPALDSLVQRALTSNFTLVAAYARLSQARATLASARADLFPNIDASIDQSATRQSNSGNQRFVNSTNGNAFSFDRDASNWSDTRTLQFSASYELDLWGRVRNARNAAGFEQQASAADLQAAAVSLAGDIATNWYSLAELRARIDLLQRQIETNRDVLDLTTFAFNHGQAAAADVLRQRQTVESVQGQLEQAHASADVVEHALAVLVGVAPEHFVAPPGGLVDLPPLPATGVPTAALMQRPDVRQQFLAVAAADRRVAVAIADQYPQLSLSASTSTTTDSAPLFTNWVTQLGASLTQPLFDAGARAAEVRRTRAVVDEQLADYQQALLEGLQETEDALTNEYRQQRYLVRIDRQLDLSEDVVANLRLRYLRGATDYLDVLDALLTRQSLQVDRLTAQRQLLDYRINLYRSLAGGVGDARLLGRDRRDTDAPPVPLRPPEPTDQHSDAAS